MQEQKKEKGVITTLHCTFTALIDLVVHLVKQDKTAPDPKNLGIGWRTDRLLTDIEALVIGRDNDPALYAEIARGALAQLQAVGRKSPEITALAMMVVDDRAALAEAAWGQPEIVALLRLAEFNGERRLAVSQVSQERENFLLRKAQELEMTIPELSDGARKMRIQSLFQYHRGVFYNDYGKFDMAADAQKQAAEAADLFGDMPGAGICRFMETVYRLKKELASTNPLAVSLGEIFNTMIERCYLVVEATRGSALEVQWGEWNGPVHVLLACVWLGKINHPVWNTWVATALAAASKLGKAYEPLAQLVRAVDLKSDSSLNAIAKDTSQPNENRATALLALMQLALANPKGQLAAVGLAIARDAFSRMPETGARHIRAVAARLLESLPGV